MLLVATCPKCDSMFTTEGPEPCPDDHTAPNERPHCSLCLVCKERGYRLLGVLHWKEDKCPSR